MLCLDFRTIKSHIYCTPYGIYLLFCNGSKVVCRKAFSAFIVLAGITGAWAQQSPPDFSGVWKMDPARSESAHQAVPIGPVVLVVKQTPTAITIETRRSPAGSTKFQSETLTYLLNGADTTNGEEDGKRVRTKARWDGASLITETERNVNGASVTTKFIHTLNASRREMKLDKTLMVQHGYQFEGSKSYGTGTDVFVKSAQ